jgi:hypothetical protein
MRPRSPLPAAHSWAGSSGPGPAAAGPPPPGQGARSGLPPRRCRRRLLAEPGAWHHRLRLRCCCSRQGCQRGRRRRRPLRVEGRAPPPRGRRSAPRARRARPPGRAGLGHEGRGATRRRPRHRPGKIPPVALGPVRARACSRFRKRPSSSSNEDGCPSGWTRAERRAVGKQHSNITAGRAAAHESCHLLALTCAQTLHSPIANPRLPPLLRLWPPTWQSAVWRRRWPLLTPASRAQQGTVHRLVS